MRVKTNLITVIWIVPAVLSFIYGCIVLSVGSGSGFYIFWFGLAVLFGGLAAAARLGLWRKLPVKLRRAGLAVAAVGLCFFLGVEAMLIGGMRQKPEPDLDAIIVLGAQVYESGPSRVLRFRLDRAIEYLNENPDTICIVTGGQGSNEPFPEAEGMAAYMERNGICSERILLEDQSRTTFENLANSLPMIEEGASVGIVTNDFHMYRALQIAADAGGNGISGITAESTVLFLPNNLCREFFAEMKYILL